MRDFVFVFMFAHFAGVHFFPTATHVELALGGLFGAVTFLVVRGRPEAPRA